jgi:hypothetical protein
MGRVSKTWLIQEGSSPFDSVLMGKRALEIPADNPWAALEQVRRRGIEVECFWALDDLWIAGYDKAEALEAALDWCGATSVRVEVSWGFCKLSWGGLSWRGAIDAAISTAIGLWPQVGPAAVFTALERRTA